jgi:hypothetical protein
VRNSSTIHYNEILPILGVLKNFCLFFGNRKSTENRVLMRIFGPKRDEVTGDWRTLHNEELHD